MAMDAEKIIADFLNFTSTGAIAKRYGVHQQDVKVLVRSALPEPLYLQTYHAIGGKKVSAKLENPKVRERYSQKMKLSVRHALATRMRDADFRMHWKKKARLASIRGNKRIKELLKNPAFSELWSRKCAAGALSLKSSAKGIFNPSLKNRRRAWSILGLKHTGKKVRGPLGERMYNPLEVHVAEILLANDFAYSYGKMVPADNINGYFSIDFFGKDAPVIIEATYWDKIEEKCAELKRKFIYFRKKFPRHCLVLVTKETMRAHYKRLLPDNISVLTPSMLGQFIAGLKSPGKAG